MIINLMNSQWLKKINAKLNIEAKQYLTYSSGRLHLMLLYNHS